MANRYDEIFAATRFGGMGSITPTLTEEEQDIYKRLRSELIASEIEEKRDKLIYMSAVDGTGIDGLDPPPSSGELLLYEKRCKYMRAEEARAEAEGRTFVWDIPFDR